MRTWPPCRHNLALQMPSVSASNVDAEVSDVILPVAALFGADQLLLDTLVSF